MDPEHALKYEVKPLSLEEHLSRFPNELLDNQCADTHLIKLTDSFSEWQGDIAVGLELTLVEIRDIELAWPREPQTQRIKMFIRWKEKMGTQATYRYVHKKYTTVPPTCSADFQYNLFPFFSICMIFQY